MTAKYGWKPWNGGECPVRRGILVETMWSDGMQYPAVDDAPGFVWSHDQGHPKLIAYRVVGRAPKLPPRAKAMIRFMEDLIGPDGEIYGHRE